MSYCGETTAVKQEGQIRTAVSLRCRSWTCPDCQDMRKRQLIAQAIDGNPNKFLTITLRRRERETAEQAAKRLSWGWRVCRLRLMRRYKVKSIPFLAVMERHKSGWPHLHILLRAKFIPQKLISEIMRELIDGPNVWIEALDKSHKAAIYCAKYCTKCEEKIGTSKRYWQSKDWDQSPPEKHEKFKKKQGGWDRWQETLDQMIFGWQQLAWRVDRVSFWKAIAHTGPP